MRANARQYEAISGLSARDERYQRVRKAAVAMIPHLFDDFGMDPVEVVMFRNILTPPTKIVGLQRAYA